MENQSIRPPQEPLHKVSLSAPWLLAQAGDLFSPAKTFHSGPISPPASLSASSMFAASLQLRQLTWFFFFLSLLAISAWFYTLSHSDISEENLLFYWQCSVLCQLSSVLTPLDPAALGQLFRGGAANLTFPTVL